MSDGLILSPAAAQAHLTGAGQIFSRFIDKPIFDIGLYAPRGEDLQKPHVRDEAYVVASGAAAFWRDGATTPVATGDMIFVEAGAQHRFVEMSEDFSAWVFFFGERPPSGN